MNGEVLNTSETPEAFGFAVGPRKTVSRIETGIISGS